MSEIVNRKACEKDREQIASLIANNFQLEFNSFCKDSNKLSIAMAHAIVIDSFYVAEKDGEVVGIVGIADNIRRALCFSKKELRKHFGLLRSSIGYTIFKKELMNIFNYNDKEAFIDFVAVHKNFRRQGIATDLINYIFENGNYSQYELYVLEERENAKHCYEKLGFKEFNRVNKKHTRIYMRKTL